MSPSQQNGSQKRLGTGLGHSSPCVGPLLPESLGYLVFLEGVPSPPEPLSISCLETRSSLDTRSH